jgi:hypothetical protein
MALPTINIDKLDEFIERERNAADYPRWSLNTLLDHYVTVANEYYGITEKRPSQSWTELHLELRALQAEFNRRVS